MRNLLKRLIIPALVGAIPAVAATAQAPARRVDPKETIPFDAAVHTGTLPNGLRFYIRENRQPGNRLALRLAVKAGSLDEADDQQGIAHFIEHMAFNGSAHFKPGELVSYFESVGSRLGPHVNAYTSFEETVYQLELPTDRPDIVSRGFSALADFAGGVTFDPAEVDKERGVVIEEWRNGLGAGSRIRDRQVPVLYFKSRFAERIPIGKPDIIRTAPAARLRAFYDTWYRPDAMAVVAVGQVDAKQLESVIRQTFGPLKARAKAVKHPDPNVPAQSELLVNVTADPEMTSSSVQLIRKRPREGERLVGDYRRDLIGQLFQRMLNTRLDELSRKADAKFLSAGGGDSALGHTVNAFSLSARVKDGEIAEGLAAIEIEARRVREYGFTASEFSLARRAIGAFYQRAFDERDKTESGQLANEYIRNFLIDEPSPGIDYEFQLVRQLLGEVTLDDVTALARSRLADNSRVVLATLPQKAGLTPPSDTDLRAILTSADRVAVTPPAFNDAPAAREIMSNRPAPAEVVSRREIPALGITVVKYANGVEAWLKPTDFKNDQVIFSLAGPGGSSLADQANFPNAATAASYVRLSGLDNIKALDLQKMLTGTSANAGPAITTTMQAINGGTSPGGVELSLQLLHQTFVAPGDDPDALALMKRQLDASLANRGQNPAQVFSERLSEVNSSNHYMMRPLTSETVAGLDRAKMMAFYRDRFANAADFTFFMVGAFRLDEVLPMIGRYVGTLPSTGTASSKPRDVGMHFPSTIERVKVERGREPRAQTVMSFFANPAIDSAEQERVGAATSVLQTVLRDVLRESLGQTYGVSVGLVQSPFEPDGGYIRVSFAGAPQNMDGMIDRTLQEIRRLQEEGPSAAAIDTVKETARRQYEIALRDNGYWLGQLQSARLLGKDPSDIVTRNERINAITLAGVQDAFKKYFPMSRYTIVTLVPEQ